MQQDANWFSDYFLVLRKNKLSICLQTTILLTFFTCLHENIYYVTSANGWLARVMGRDVGSVTVLLRTLRDTLSPIWKVHRSRKFINEKYHYMDDNRYTYHAYCTWLHAGSVGFGWKDSTALGMMHPIPVYDVGRFVLSGNIHWHCARCLRPFPWLV